MDWIAHLTLAIALLALPLLCFTVALPLSRPCYDVSPLTRFVVPYLSSLAAAQAVRLTLRRAWPNNRLSGVKEREAVGDLTKCIGRFLILATLLPLWSTMSFTSGLELGMPCHLARAAFDSARYLIAAMMAWELAYNPASPKHVYVHHIFLLLLVVWGVDAAILGGSWRLVAGGGAGAEGRPAVVNGYVFLLLHAAVVGPPVKEAFIVRYRMTPRSDGAARARWLRRAAFSHVMLTMFTVVVMPIFYVVGQSVYAAEPIGIGPIALGVLLVVCLLLIEAWSLYHLLVIARALAKRDPRPHQPPTAELIEKMETGHSSLSVLHVRTPGTSTSSCNTNTASPALSHASDKLPAARVEEEATMAVEGASDCLHVPATPTTKEVTTHGGDAFSSMAKDLESNDDDEDERLAATFHARTTDPSLAPLARSLPNTTKLTLYALFKQATMGDCGTVRPGAFDVRARAKFDAWSKTRGRTKEEAMREYLSVLESVIQ